MPINIFYYIRKKVITALARLIKVLNCEKLSKEIFSQNNR